MKIIYGSWCGRKTFKCGRDVATTGYDNIPMFLDGYWYDLDDAAEQHIKADLVLAATPPIHFFHKIKRKPFWKKLVMMQESGFDMANCVPFLDVVMDAPIDGFLLHNKALVQLYQGLGKPVYHFDHPYFWEKAEQFNVLPKEPNTCLVNLSRFGTYAGNPLGTLAVIRRMPHVQFVSYFHDLERMKGWCSKLGITNLDCRPATGWDHLMRDSSRYAAFLTMDQRVSIGRFVYDAAAMNVPCVGAYSEAQAYLFPEFMVDQFDIDGAVTKLTEALSHNGNYPISQEKKHFYSLDRFKDHFQTVCEEMMR